MDLVASADYKTNIDDWNYFAAGKAWTKAWLEANDGKTVSEELMATYAGRMRKVTVADYELTLAPEMPEFAIAPMAYPGPAIFAAFSGDQPASTFKPLGGMGLQTLGKLGWESIAGYGHSFGVRGQGNEATAELTDSDLA
jgi:hypothetical protein